MQLGFRVFHNNEELAAIRISTSIVKIGRIASAQLRLDDPSVSRYHCILDLQPAPTILDLGSTTGTRIAGTKISRHVLQLGDRVEIGEFTLVVATPEDTWRTTPVTLAATASGLPSQLAYLEATPKQSAHVPAVATPSVAPQLAAVDLLSQLDPEDRAYAEQIGVLLVVGIDKLREHRGRSGELGEAYAAMLECISVIRVTRAAPSILIELTHGVPATEHDGRPAFAASIAQHDAMWPHLLALANLPGFSKICALAAVAAGRDPLPWLAHPFGEVRVVAAQNLRDPNERRRACASVWASYIASDMSPRYDWSGVYAAESEMLHDLPPIGMLVDGLFSDCADQRAWTLVRVANRRSIADPYGLVVAAELDAARARAGWPQTEIDWSRWHGVPQAADERAAWIRARARTAPDEIPPIVHAMLAYAPREVAPPKLVLSEDAYEAVLDQERCAALAALQELERMGTHLEFSKVLLDAETRQGDPA